MTHFTVRRPNYPPSVVTLMDQMAAKKPEPKKEDPPKKAPASKKAAAKKKPAKKRGAR